MQKKNIINSKTHQNMILLIYLKKKLILQLLDHFKNCIKAFVRVEEKKKYLQKANFKYYEK